jgi:hypothetical protein
MRLPTPTEQVRVTNARFILSGSLRPTVNAQRRLRATKTMDPMDIPIFRDDARLLMRSMVSVFLSGNLD